MNPRIQFFAALTIAFTIAFTPLAHSFEQEVDSKTTYSEQSVVGTPVSLETGPGDSVWLLTESALYRIDDNKPIRIDDRMGVAIHPGMKMAAVKSAGGGLILADEKGFYVYSPGGKPNFFETAIGPVNSAALSPMGDIVLAAQGGLYIKRRGSNDVVKIEEVPAPVTLAAAGPDRRLAAVSEGKLWTFDGQDWRFEWIHALIGPDPSALEYDAQGRLWIGNAECIHWVWPDGRIERIDGYDGLPRNRVTALSAGNDGSMWIATLQGVIRWRNGEWNDYAGPRWQPGEVVSGVASLTDGGCVLADDVGLATIRMEQWTLEEKALYYHEQVYPRHDRDGLVADVALTRSRDPHQYKQRPTDNDGLWTSIYLAALCFQYAVEKDPEVKQLAWKHFEALERLETITGTPGLFARSFARASDFSDTGGEWHRSSDNQWYWKGDTSSDELVGHMFVYPLVYDLLAETRDEKERVHNLVDRIMSRIVDNGYYLIDVDGEPTRWGVWAPEKLNQDPEWAQERGLNSLQMLSFLAAALHVTENERYHTDFVRLAANEGYAANTINQKITLPYEDNYSDDELAFLPYYTLFQYDPEPRRWGETFRTSLRRSWNAVKDDKSSLWNVIASACLNEKLGVGDAIWTLEEWPLDLTDWPVPVESRLDVTLSRYADRFGQKQIVNLLPPDERRVMRWNANPYVIGGGNGGSIDDPGAWLLPYWMARYHHLFE
ncbi:MAG: hypothetical protein GC154_03270 [bacterium]|nr:hypothetical protein [bacterium]